jgi:glycosyltransferase involved in cell wall biosynthesis
MTQTKKKILVLASTFPRWKNDTVPEFVYDFSKNLSKEVNITVLSPHDKNAKFHEELDGIQVWRFPYFIPSMQLLAYRGGMINAFKENFLAKVQLPFFLLSEFIFAFFLVKNKEIDLIQAHWLFPQGFVAYLVKIVTGIPIIITTHGGDIAILKNKHVLKVLRPVLLNANAITFVSEINKSQVQELINAKEFSKKLFVLPMGVYLPVGRKTSKHKTTNLLFIGRLVAIKGLDILIKALPSIVNTHKNIKLKVLGDGPLKSDWKQLAKNLGVDNYISFEGYKTGLEKDKSLKESDIVVIPSIIDRYGYQEGLPVVALEALSYGKVLIATKTGGLPSLLSKRNGLLIKPNNVSDLSTALLKIIPNKNMQRTISKNAEVTSKNYSWQVISNNFINIMENTL